MADYVVLFGFTGSLVASLFSQRRGWSQVLASALIAGFLAHQFAGSIVAYSEITEPTAGHFESTGFMLGMCWRWAFALCCNDIKRVLRLYM